jgi:hypothetical protein
VLVLESREGDKRTLLYLLMDGAILGIVARLVAQVGVKRGHMFVVG